MLSIEKKGNDKGFLNPVDSGVRFGTSGEPLRFVLEGQRIGRIVVDLDIVIDEKVLKPEWETKTVDTSFTVKFKHPKKSERSGLSNPVGFAKGNHFVVGLMFWVETIGDAPSFRMTYEFYGDEIAAEEGGEK